MIIIYTDGSSKGNPGPGGWAAIVVSKENVREIGGHENHTTNNRMELTAVVRALESLSPGEVEEGIKLHTDSEYIVKGITAWVDGWQRNNWRTAAKKPVLNQDLWQALVHVSENKDIDWTLVRGHAGVPANERCDVIATSFADASSFKVGSSPIDLYEGPRTGYTIKV